MERKKEIWRRGGVRAREGGEDMKRKGCSLCHEADRTLHCKTELHYIFLKSL